MKKEKFVEPQVLVVRFTVEDVITTSGEEFPAVPASDEQEVRYDA